MHSQQYMYSSTAAGVTDVATVFDATGAVIVALIADNHATKLAYRMARALLSSKDELQVVTVVASEESIQYGTDLLAPYIQEPCENTVTPVVSASAVKVLDMSNCQHTAALRPLQL